MGTGACPLRILVMDGEPLNAKDRRTYPPDERCFASQAGPNLQITGPNNFPMPAVRAIANAPQIVPRTWRAECLRRLFLPRSHPEARESPKTQRIPAGQAHTQ